MLHSLKHTIRATIVNVCVRIFHLLPISLAASIKEGLNFTGRLDYPQCDIYMSVDSSTQFNRLNACRKEPETVQWIASTMRPGDVLYDVGANVGAYSLVACAVTRGNCTVYAFEPSFSTFAALSQNVLLNCSQHAIIPLHVALANTTQMMNFHYASLAPGAALHNLSGGLVNSSVAHVASTRLPIMSYRLDDLVRLFNLRLPTHIKLDVDGIELDILQGAKETLVYPGLRSILIEVDESSVVTKEVVFYLQEKGFSIFSKHPHFGLASFANYIFIRE